MKKQQITINLVISYEEKQKGVQYGDVVAMDIIENAFNRIEYIAEDIDDPAKASEVAECIRRYLICDKNVRL